MFLSQKCEMWKSLFFLLFWGVMQSMDECYDQWETRNPTLKNLVTRCSFLSFKQSRRTNWHEEITTITNFSYESWELVMRSLSCRFLCNVVNIDLTCSISNICNIHIQSVMLDDFDQICSFTIVHNMVPDRIINIHSLLPHSPQTLPWFVSSLLATSYFVDSPFVSS